jgi:protein-tyrosine phosphatase
MNHIIDGIYVGAKELLKRQQVVKQAGIQAVVRLDNADNLNWSPKDYTLLYEPFDDGNYIPKKSIPLVTGFIHEQIVAGKKVLVHCAAGRSRSVCMVMAYLIEYKQMSLGDAFHLVFRQRPEALPNPVLIASLIGYYQLPTD